jgi:hypothetical protein
VTGIVVSDAGPLIALSRVRQLHLLKSLYRFVVIPPSVHGELGCGTRLTGAKLLEAALYDGWLKVQSLTGQSSKLSTLGLLLDQGESEAIVLAETIDCRFLLIDERKGRQVAKSRGLSVVGTAGVLLSAKHNGLIKSVSPVISALGHEGYRLSDSLNCEILKLAKE